MKKPAPRNLFYVHFTDDEGLQSILATKELWESSIVTGVYAVALGGAYVPSVQETSLGRAKHRKRAVLFSTNIYPDKVFPEEVIWRRKSIPLLTAVEIPYKKAVRLLDSSKMWEDLDAPFGFMDGVWGYPTKDGKQKW